MLPVLTTDKEKFHTKYEKLLLYIVKALGLSEGTYIINHNRNAKGVGHVSLNTGDVFIEIGSFGWFNENNSQVKCKWVFSKDSQEGGLHQWFSSAMLHHPETMMRIIYKLMEEKKGFMDINVHRLIG